MKLLASTGADPLRSLAHDTLVRWTLLLFGVSIAVSSLPTLSPTARDSMEATWIPLAFLALVLIALKRGLGSIPRAAERSFWNDLAVAFACWPVILLLRLLPMEWQSARVPMLLEDVLWALHYLAFLLALERRAHRRNDWRPVGLERSLALPSVAIFVLGLLTYFVLIPALTDSEAYDSNMPSFYLFTSLDLYLAAVLVYLAVIVTADRWRKIYSLLALSTCSFLATDLLEAYEYGTPGWHLPAFLTFLWNVPFVCLVAAARIRHAEIAGSSGSGMSLAPVAGSLSGPANRTLVIALAVPLLHFVCRAFGLLDEDAADLRESLVFWWLAGMGVLALLQDQVLGQKVRAIWHDRGRFEASVRDSEDDLRLLVERRHTETELLKSELQFAEAFLASEDALAITTVRSGRLLELNECFERIYGYHREESVGRTVNDLGLWARPDERHAFVEELKRSKAIRDREIDLYHASGALRRVLFSAVLIDFEGQSCLLSVTHDLREPDSADITQPSALLERADDAISILDSEGHLTYWNRACETLYGWHSAEALGRSFTALVGHDLEAHLTAWKTAAEHGEWIGELRQIARDGRQLQVGSRWITILDADGLAAGQLVLSFEAEESAGQTVQGVSLPPPCSTEPPTSSPASVPS